MLNYCIDKRHTYLQERFHRCPQRESVDNQTDTLYFMEYFGYHINMKISSVIKYRNLFILVATFSVLCLSPLADIHFEVNSNEKAYVHGREHNETNFSMLIHELLFTQLQHTLDNVIPGIFYPSLKTNKNLSLKGNASSSYSQAFCSSNSQTITIHPLKGVALLHDHKRAVGTFSREYSGLSPPLV